MQIQIAYIHMRTASHAVKNATSYRVKDARREVWSPVPSPTMAGGLFTISKAYFEKLGLYDSGFDIWGGENLELSFKVMEHT